MGHSSLSLQDAVLTLVVKHIEFTVSGLVGSAHSFIERALSFIEYFLPVILHICLHSFPAIRIRGLSPARRIPQSLQT